VVVTRIFELRIVRHIRERILYIGDKEHTIFFKYEICKIDDRGTITRSVSFYINFIEREILASYIYFISIGNEENTLQMVSNRR